MDIDAVIEELARDERSMRFKRLKAICDYFFGQPRIRGSHHIYQLASRKRHWSISKATKAKPSRTRSDKRGGFWKSSEIEVVVKNGQKEDQHSVPG